MYCVSMFVVWYFRIRRRWKRDDNIRIKSLIGLNWIDCGFSFCQLFDDYLIARRPNSNQIVRIILFMKIVNKYQKHSAFSNRHSYWSIKIWKIALYFFSRFYLPVENWDCLCFCYVLHGIFYDLTDLTNLHYEITISKNKLWLNIVTVSCSMDNKQWNMTN